MKSRISDQRDSRCAARTWFRVILLAALFQTMQMKNVTAEIVGAERQLTFDEYNHIMTNVGAWSYDGRWIYYDVRTDPDGAVFDGRRIERVHADSGHVETVFESRDGACCGVVIASPVDERIIFIHGPENPTSDWSYSAWHRRGVIVHPDDGQFATLDACDVVAPYTPGALRGGTHVHVFSGDGQWVSFTYEDHVLAATGEVHAEKNQRNVGIAAPYGPVRVPRSHPRNHDGIAFSVLVTKTVDFPKPGSDEINRAYEEAWVGTDGYRKADGKHQKRALAFLGDIVDDGGKTTTELFIVDIPDNVTLAGSSPLHGTPTTRPTPPSGTTQRRLTYSTARKFGGISGVRHWPRSSPDGSRIAFLMRDEAGVVQIWLISPNGGPAEQLTRNAFPIESAFSWRPDGRAIACVAGGSVCSVEVPSGMLTRLTPEFSDTDRPRAQACVFSPDGTKIAYVRPVRSNAGTFNQVFVANAEVE